MNLEASKRPDLLKREGGQVLRYGIAGVFGNLLVYLIYILLTLILEIWPNPAFAISNMLVLPLSFLVSWKWTFRSNVFARRAFPAFVIGYLCSYALQASALYLGLRFTRIPHTYLLPMAQVGAILFFFSLQRLVIFSRLNGSSGGSRVKRAGLPSQTSAETASNPQL